MRLARLALLGATTIWGTSFVIVQRAIADVPVFHFLTLRFGLATLLLAALLAWRGRGGRRHGAAALPLRDGVVLGVLLFAGFALQTHGLRWTTPSRSAFLTGLAVVLVPGLAWLAALPDRRRRAAAEPAPAASPPPPPLAAEPAPHPFRRLRLAPLAAALCAAAGLYTLYRPAGLVAGGAGGAFGRGDALTLVGTFALAWHIVAIERVVRFRAAALVPLAAVQFGVVALLAAPSLLTSAPHAAELTPFALFAISFSGIASTALAFLCQLYAQRHLPATETAVLLTFEPVVAALFSVAVGREAWTLSLALGGILVVAAMLLAELGGGAAAVPPAVAAPGS